MTLPTNSDTRTPSQKKEEVRMGVIFAFCLFLFFFTMVFFIYRNMHIRLHHDLDQQQLQEVSAMGGRVQDVFSRIEVYLVHVSNLYTVRRILKQENPEMRKAVERFFSKLIEANVNRFNPTFDQVRLLDLKGMEIVRVDLGEQNEAKVSRFSQLQDKSNRYYYRESMGLAENQVYMSPMDLNMEQGKIEIPHKPMIRFVTPVFDTDGNRIGLLVFNYLAQQILRDLSGLNMHKGDQWILLNEDGYYLHGPDPDKNFGFMFPEKKAGFFSDYPEFWKALSTSRDQKFNRPDGIYYRNRITPFAADTEKILSNIHTWTLFMFVPQKNIHRQDMLLIQGILLATSIIAPILLMLGWFLGKSRVKNNWYLKSLEESARKDSMTGLLNHRAAMDQLEYQLNVAERSGNPLSLTYIDLNDLKSVNDTLGHRKGDQLILLVADSIEKAIRKTDIAARIGGDEFIVILPGLPGDNAREVLQRIEGVYAQKSQEIFSRKLTLSWGVSIWKGGSDSAENLIKRADKEMYKMKQQKKGFSFAKKGRGA